ncbi:MAG: hypothetical protein RL260_1015, partial [Pseudomonadota bacterium]
QGKLLKWGKVDGGLWESTNADPFAENSLARPIFVRRSSQLSDPSRGSLLPRIFGPTNILKALGRAPDPAESCITCEDLRFKDYSPSWQARPR